VRIAILAYEGFDELDALGPYEVLRNAASGGADVEVLLVTDRPAERVTGAHELTVEPQGTLADGGFDLVIVPGGGWYDRAAAGAYAEVERGELPARLRQIHEAGTTVAAVCTGGMLVGAAGLARGRPATTHHLAIEELRAQGAAVTDARVVDDGDLLSCGGVTAGIDLALWIVEREWGNQLADGIARAMEHERRGQTWTRNARVQR
jgi:transcriptional regulator GlxA family with amidase domain